METIDFKENKVQVITLDTLERTYRENDIYGNPQKGIYHFELINKIIAIANNNNLNCKVWDLFAAQNANRTMPGVSILPQIEAQICENAVEAHVLRRTFANIQISDLTDGQTVTNLAVAFHQKGIEVAIGEAVVICHNQTILSPKHIVRSFGENALTPDEILQVVNTWLSNVYSIKKENEEKIQRMKAVQVDADFCYKFIGILTSLRVAKDSKDKRIHKLEMYPLNQSQISLFTANLMVRGVEKEGNLNLFDIYDCANELYKGDTMDIPNILTQNLAFAKLLEKFY